jgi:hypothetical protein
MASGRPSFAQVRGWPGAVGFALAAAWASAHGPERLVHGGLAPLSVAAVAAAFFALPLARLEWRTGPLDAPPGRHEALRRFAASLGPMWGVLLVGAAAGPLVRDAGGAGLALAIVVWVVLALLVRRTGAALAVVLAVLALLVATAGAGVAFVKAPPWTLLDPRWETWRTWLPQAVAAGFVLGGPGLGHWSSWPSIPGERRAPWLSGGFALLLALAVATWSASAYEATAGQADPVVGMGLLGVAAGAVAVLSRPIGRATLRMRAVGGIAATIWFAGPAYDALPVWWSSLVLAGPAVVAGTLAVVHRGPARLFAATSSVVAAAAAVAAWPGLPQGSGAAAAVACIGVAAVWIAGTAAVVPPREVTP